MGGGGGNEGASRTVAENVDPSYTSGATRLAELHAPLDDGTVESATASDDANDASDGAVNAMGIDDAGPASSVGDVSVTAVGEIETIESASEIFVHDDPELSE